MQTRERLRSVQVRSGIRVPDAEIGIDIADALGDLRAHDDLPAFPCSMASRSRRLTRSFPSSGWRYPSSTFFWKKCSTYTRSAIVTVETPPPGVAKVRPRREAIGIIHPGNLEVEQDRAPAVLQHHTELARPAAGEPGRGDRANKQDHNQDRPHRRVRPNDSPPTRKASGSRRPRCASSPSRATRSILNGTTRSSQDADGRRSTYHCELPNLD